MQSRLWKNLAAICVKTKRTDTTFYCFGQMRDAYGVELIKKSENEPCSSSRKKMQGLQWRQFNWGRLMMPRNPTQNVNDMICLINYTNFAVMGEGIRRSYEE
ncbi:hypothetical protein KC19_VG040600 [Ceratodon purpureus]|uniref:IF140/IFT172/WDR19 TPR domain-containing protein n=1 Tax=Ceratodon purpureus TaxID=3225 RepID=A0A8T0HLT0_CERPU|nr:hypothetical protein KC19_VG040600 [Ceratodon purpureus]